MALRRMIDTSFWNDTYIEGLKSQAKLLFMYLISNPHTTSCGIYSISLQRITYDTSLTKSFVKKQLKQFESDGKVIYNEKYSQIMMINWVKYFNLDSRSIQKNVYTALNEVKDVRMIELFIQNVEKHSKSFRVNPDEIRLLSDTPYIPTDDSQVSVYSTPRDTVDIVRVRERGRERVSSSTPLITQEENTTTQISEMEIKTSIDNLMGIVRNNVSEDSLSGWGGMISFVLQGKGKALLEDSTEPLPQLSKEKLEGWLKKYFGEIQFSEEPKMFGRWLHEKHKEHLFKDKLQNMNSSCSNDIRLMLDWIFPVTSNSQDLQRPKEVNKTYEDWINFLKAEYDTLKEDSEKNNFKESLKIFISEITSCPGNEYARTPWGFARFLDHTANPNNFDWCKTNIEPKKKEDFIPTVM